MLRATFLSTGRQVAVAVFAACLCGVPQSAQANDPVFEWNDIARGMIVVPAFSPVQQTRAMAIVQVAIHDAVNAITKEYERYLPGGPAPAGATAEAAAIGAGYGALKGIFGESTPLTERYNASITATGLTAGDPGLAFGESVAAQIVALRQNDGSASAAHPYAAPGAGLPGVWTPISAAPAAQALLPGWGNVAPFVLHSASQFRPEPPPALSSDDYARDFNELKAIGGQVSSVRTEEQRNIALFWRASPTALWNPILRTAIQSQDMSLSDRARTMALFYLAASDASVACWEAKYFYNSWRPEPAIVRGAEDGNDATVADPGWRPLIPTPPHPDYISGHAANSGAMAHVLARVFGDEPGFVIEMTSSQNPGFVRHWQTFGEGVQEVIDARVYSGIHFRTADEVGARVGRQVAQFVLTHALKPRRPGKG